MREGAAPDRGTPGDVTIELGTVIAPSGAILIMDAGLLGLWSHDRVPVVPASEVPSEDLERLNSAVDGAIVGSDAVEVGRALDRQWDPRFVYDIPRDLAAKVGEDVRAAATARKLDARLEIMPARVPHRRRADSALAHGNGAGEVQTHGLMVGVLSGLPPGALRVVGKPMPEDDPEKDRLRRITLEVRDGVVARSDQFAFAAVEHGMLIFVDLDAVGAWQQDEPLDGLADVAWWGGDAEEAARRLGAGVIGTREFGWRDLPVADARARAREVRALEEAKELRFAWEYRPHSHLHQLMEQVRASRTESGIVALGDARACGFATTWGDGLFELHRDLDVDGNLLRVRIELGTERQRELMRRLKFRTFARAMVSRSITDDGEPVRFMYREEAMRDEDSGWRMMSGLETDEYLDDADNIVRVPLTAFAELDPRVAELLDSPIGSVFERKDADEDFAPVTDWQPPED